MSDVITGTKKAKEVRIHKSTQGVRKVRCQRDQGLVVPRSDGKGGVTYQCTICRREFSFTAL